MRLILSTAKRMVRFELTPVKAQGVADPGLKPLDYILLKIFSFCFALKNNFFNRVLYKPLFLCGKRKTRPPGNDPEP